MTNLIVEISKYLMILLMAIYTYANFRFFSLKEPEAKRRVCGRQNRAMFAIHFLAYVVLCLKTEDEAFRFTLMAFYGAQVVFFLCYIYLYRLIYRNVSRLLVNNTCMLLCVGFIMLTRLSLSKGLDKALRQFAIVVAAAAAAWLVPYVMGRFWQLYKLQWVYAGAGLLVLLVVWAAGNESFGAQLSITIGSISVQPSEFVKLSFVFFVASMFYQSLDFKTICITTAVAAAHVVVMVLSKDLGGALIFFITYVIVLYVASQNSLYLISALAAGTLAAVVAWRLFSHVQVRVLAWQDPWSTIDNEGYQVARSLFAIGTGGWFGMGLGEGMPNSIPVASSDFIFSAICEELGVIFAICLILVEISCFVLFVNIALKMKRRFYKLTALGLAVEYIFQVFLTIGGVTKFIPSTGVTLPLISYGGSSVMSTIILFCIIQGMYVLNFEEEDQDGSKEQYQKEQRGRNTSAKRKRLSQTQVR